jgi:hypothetical protein
MLRGARDVRKLESNSIGKEPLHTKRKVNYGR